MNFSTILVFVVLLLGSRGSAQHSGPREQSTFGAEDESWEHQVPIPEDVLQILRKTPGDVLEKLRKANIGLPEDLSSDSFLASEIHLNSPQERDLILMGIRNLRLPHAALFWVFRPIRNGHELILSTGGDSLEVLNIRKNGYRQIRVYNNTASTTTGAVYGFDGKQYTLMKQKTKPIS
jgi:hypothetical protein